MDERWKQRCDNFARALRNLEAGLNLGTWNEFERQGVIKAFELSYELAWKTLQDLLIDREMGQDVSGPKAVLRASLEAGWLADSDLWARIHEGRNRAAHVYDSTKSEALFQEIRFEFFPAFVALHRVLAGLQ